MRLYVWDVLYKIRAQHDASVARLDLSNRQPLVRKNGSDTTAFPKPDVLWSQRLENRETRCIILQIR